MVMLYKVINLLVYTHGQSLNLMLFDRDNGFCLLESRLYFHGIQFLLFLQLDYTILLIQIRNTYFISNSIEIIKIISMDAFIQLESLQLSQDITIRAEWPAQERFIATKGQIVFGKYIIVPANDIVFLDGKNNQQVFASRYIIGGKNIQKPLSLDIDTEAFTQVNVDKNDLLGCIQFTGMQIENRQFFKGIVRFFNLTEFFSMQKPFNVNIPAIVPQQKIIESSSNKGQHKDEISLNEPSSQVLSPQFQSSIDSKPNILDQPNLQDVENEKQMMPNLGKNKQIKMEEPLKMPSVALKFPKTQFSWDKTTPFAEKFLIQGLKVQNNAGDQTVPKNAINDITFRLHQYGGNYDINFGIITQSRKNYSFSDGYGQQSVGYISHPNNQKGKIRIDGKEVQGWIGQAFVEVNGTLLMRVDTIKYQITFISSSSPKKEFLYQLEQQHWKSKEIYAYVSMPNKGDSVSICSI